MSADLAFELWSELKRYVNSIDRNEAADTLVNLLIDNDYDVDDIRTLFKSDSDVKQALKSYLGDAEEEELDEEEEDDYDDSY